MIVTRSPEGTAGGAARANRPAVDAATVEVIRHYLSSAANEMERTLVRTAYTTIIYEINDFGLSIFDKDLRLLADSTGLPVFLGANEYAVNATFERGEFGTLEPGDVLMMSIPYITGTHTNDAILVRPAYFEGELVAYACVRAHWTDVGGKDPGYILDSTSIHQEGVMLPGIKIFERDQPNDDVLRIMRANSRAPVTIMGDLNAEVASLRIGCQRIEELFAKYTKATVEAAIERFLEVGESQAREAVRALPNGSWSAENWMDNDGVDDRLVRVAVTVTIDDDEMTLDFSESDGAVRGPINLAIGMTHSMCRIVFKTLTTPDEPTNSGQFRPLNIVAPEGTLFHAAYPSPVFTIWACVVGMETIYKALAEAIPDRVPASSGGDMGDPGFYGKEPYTGRQVWHQTNAGVGWGAHHDCDGLNTIHHISMNTMKNIPVEVIETRLPVIVDRAGLRVDSGGAGKFRGGLGSLRDYRFLDEFGALTIVKKSLTGGWGLDGGKSGPLNVTILKPNPADADWRERWARDVIVYADCDEIWGNSDPERKYCGMFRGQFGAGDVISYLAAGGGGHGDPLARDPEAVRDDVIDGYVTRAAARSEYGVAIDDAGAIDAEETRRLRNNGGG